MNSVRDVEFTYEKAFDRNLGWLKPEDQTKLRESCVAIAGLGGAGGFQAQGLARLGIGRFKIADPDTFEISNFNRQMGATVKTLGRSKLEVTKEMILSINPEARIETFPEGVTLSNMETFLQGTHAALDGIDFLALEAKILFFRTCRRLKIPAVTSCPLGFGASLMTFSPVGMSFEDYLDLRPGMSEREKKLALAFGLSPVPLCMEYMSEQAFSLESRRTASVSPGLMLVGALGAAEIVKSILRPEKVRYAPHILQLDLMTQQMVKKYYPFGMKGPWMRFKKRAVSRLLEIKLKRRASKSREA